MTRRGVSDPTVVTACFGGLPAGWSRALFFCHDILQQSLGGAQRSLRLPQRHVTDRGRTPVVSSVIAVAAPYVDNANVVASSKQLCDELLDAEVEDLAAKRLGLSCAGPSHPSVHHAWAGVRRQVSLDSSHDLRVSRSQVGQAIRRDQS